MFEKLWWTWTGSNRRPLPCHGFGINHLQTGLTCFHRGTSGQFGRYLDPMTSSTLIGLRIVPKLRRPTCGWSPRFSRGLNSVVHVLLRARSYGLPFSSCWTKNLDFYIGTLPSSQCGGMGSTGGAAGVISPGVCGSERDQQASTRGAPIDR